MIKENESRRMRSMISKAINNAYKLKIINDDQMTDLTVDLGCCPDSCLENLCNHVQDKLFGYICRMKQN